MNDLVYKFLSAFTAGAILMLVLSFTVYRKSYYYKKAQEEARGNEKKPGILSRLVTVMILLVMILFITVFDLWVSSREAYSFVYLTALNLLLVTALSLFDALFIDLLLLVVWRPALLGLPEGQPTRDSMLRHIKLQLTAGWIFKLPIAVGGAICAVVLGAGSA